MGGRDDAVPCSHHHTRRVIIIVEVAEGVRGFNAGAQQRAPAGLEGRGVEAGAGRGLQEGGGGGVRGATVMVMVVEPVVGLRR